MVALKKHSFHARLIPAFDPDGRVIFQLIAADD
jgi:hypothetical protein